MNANERKEEKISEVAMPWNIASAKQQFSDLVRRAVVEPQLIYNRKRLVAAVIDAAQYQAFKEWSEQANRRTLGDELAELRRIMDEENYALVSAPRATRPNALVQMLEEDGRDLLC